MSLGLLLNLARAQTAGAHLDPSVASPHIGTHGVKIGIEAPFSQIVSVTYIMPEKRAFPANRTYFCHISLQKKESNGSMIADIFQGFVGRMIIRPYPSWFTLVIIPVKSLRKLWDCCVVNYEIGCISF